jgi:hypothetical protein
MKKGSKYFAQAENEINQDYLNASGWEEADGNAGDWDYAFGDELEAAGSGDGRMTGGKSQPYTITIQNTTTDDISNVVILDAALKFNDFAVAGVVFGYEPNTLTYAQYLASVLAGKIFKCGKLRLIASNASTSVAETQVLENLNIETKDPNGNAVQMSFIPELDSYQFQKNQVDIGYEFNVDALTKITIATLYASTKLKIRFYPQAKVNQFKQLRGQQATSSYSAPNVNKALSRG